MYKYNKKVKIITQKNKGVSSSRNKAIEICCGNYILFLDSDDFLDKYLLEMLNKNIKNNVDLIRYQARTLTEEYDVIEEYYEDEFFLLDNYEAIKKIVKFHFIENSWLYCYRKNLLKDNNLFFDEGYLHEDFGLTPLIFLTSKKITSINYVGYNYIVRNNSIMHTKDLNLVKKKCNDFITLGLRNINIISNRDFKNKDILLSYIANSILIKGKELNKKDRKIYLRKIKNNNIDKYLLTNTLKRQIKKLIFKINYNIFLKVVSW